jgi:hypothetical protein
LMVESWAGLMLWSHRVGLRFIRAMTVSIDVFIGMYRAQLVLKHYRGFELPKGEKFNTWLNRLFKHPAFIATRNTDGLYLESYERCDVRDNCNISSLTRDHYRYAFNRPNTSQVANAINSGRSLP